MKINKAEYVNTIILKKKNTSSVNVIWKPIMNMVKWIHIFEGVEEISIEEFLSELTDEQRDILNICK